MIVSDADALRIITDRPHKKKIEAAQEYTRKLLMHVKGVGLDTYIEQIMAFEKEDIIKIRKSTRYRIKQYSHASTDRSTKCSPLKAALRTTI